MGRLTGKIIVLTGGAQGIGKTAARRLAEEGATVSIWDMDKTKADATAAELRARGFTIDVQQVNVADSASVSAAVSAVLNAYGRVDVLINNAGITRDATLLKMTDEQWTQVIDVNLKGVFNCTRAVTASMIEHKSGTIINTSSVVGLYGNFGQTNYVATKSGVIGMTKVWARELGRKGINVNAVAPGFIATEMVATIPEKVIAAIVEKTPLGRLGAPEDIANAYVFLASDEAKFINGAVLSVDGGFVG